MWIRCSFLSQRASLRSVRTVSYTHLVPNMLQRFGSSLGYVAFAAMINSMGEVATAAHTIANTVESAFYIPGYGMQTAAATPVSYTHLDVYKRQERYGLSIFLLRRSP